MSWKNKKKNDGKSNTNLSLNKNCFYAYEYAIK